MKKIFVFILCIQLFINLSQAQIFIREFGKYSNEEFQLKKYEKDTTAEAVVIYDIGESRFVDIGNGFEIIFERKMKIKIFTKAGFDWAQISIPLYVTNSKAEVIEELKGNTYNYEDGQIKISPLNVKNSYDEKYNENWFDRKFAMPEIKEGSVFEVYYRLRSPYLFNFRNWDFQNKIPVIYSEYKTTMIPFFEYTYLLQGANKFDEFKTYSETTSSNSYALTEYKEQVCFFVMKNLPAFKDESFITAPSDYMIKLDFQLAAINRPNGVKETIMTTWPEMIKELNENSSFGKYLSNCKKKGVDLLDTMKILTMSSTEKAKRIEGFVKTNFNWNGRSNKFSTKSVKELLTSKTGNSADINLFLAGMLNASGIEAYPVISSTRDHGKIKLDYPFHNFFNYVMVLAKLDSSTVLLDATEPFSNFSEIPSRCINEKGLIIQKDKVEWANLRSNSISRISYNFDLKLSLEKDSLISQCRILTTGFEAIYYRKQFTTNYKELKNNLMDDNALPKDTLISSDLNQIKLPFKISFNKKYSLESIDEKIIVQPFCNFAMAKNPLKQPVRNYPIDIIYKKSSKFQTTLTIPEGYKLAKKPSDLKIENSLIKILYTTDTLSNGLVNVVGNYEFKKDVYDVVNYKEIKYYFNVIVDKFNEGLVLIKEI